MKRYTPHASIALLLAVLIAVFARPVQAAVVTAGTFAVYLAQALQVGAMPTAAPTDEQVLSYEASTGALTWQADTDSGGDLTAVTETGDALTVTNGTGPAPDLAAHANVEAWADAGTLTAGDTFYSTGATNITRLAKGTAYQRLRMNSGATAPEWSGPGLTVEANATSNTIAAEEAEFLFTDDGTDNGNTSNNTLPAAAAGLVVRVHCVQGDANDILQVTAVGDDTIRISGAVSAAAGNAQCAATGGSLTLVAISATQWVAVSFVGTWTVT